VQVNIYGVVDFLPILKNKIEIFEK